MTNFLDVKIPGSFTRGSSRCPKMKILFTFICIFYFFGEQWHHFRSLLFLASIVSFLPVTCKKLYQNFEIIIWKFHWKNYQNFNYFQIIFLISFYTGAKFLAAIFPLSLVLLFYQVFLYKKINEWRIKPEVMFLTVWSLIQYYLKVYL